MHCREARKLAAVSGSVELPRATAAEWHAHLKSCPACREEARAQRLLLDGLASLRGAVPEEVDVSRRVLEAIRVEGAAVTSYRQAGWSAAAAVAVGVALLAALPTLISGLRAEAAGPFPVLLHVAGSLLVGLGKPLAAMAGALGSMTRGFLEAAAAMWPAVSGVMPLAMATTAGCAAALTAFALVWIGVELSRAPRTAMEDRKR